MHVSSFYGCDVLETKIDYLDRTIATIEYSGQINVKQGMILPLNGNVFVWWVPLTSEFPHVETSQPRFNEHLLSQ